MATQSKATTVRSRKALPCRHFQPAAVDVGGCQDEPAKSTPRGQRFRFQPPRARLPRGPECVLEREPLGRLAREGQLMAYRHDGFFYAMDTYREYQYLNELWASEQTVWEVWSEQVGQGELGCAPCSARLGHSAPQSCTQINGLGCRRNVPKNGCSRFWSQHLRVTGILNCTLRRA